MNTKLICLLVSLWSYQIIIAQGSYTSYKPFNHDILIHTSKPTYTAGEKIWLSIYLINSNTQQMLVLTHPVYVQLYAPNGSLVISQTIYTAAGRGSGSIKLSPSLSSGIYRLQAFTQSMVLAKQSSFEQQIYIGTQLPINQHNIYKIPDEELKIHTNFTSYSKRSPITVTIEADSSLEATVSISVYKDNYSQPVNSFDISRLSASPKLLSSETKEELFFMGKATKNNGSVVKNGQVILQMEIGNRLKFFSTETDSAGFFIFNNLDFEGEQMAYWQINNAKGKALADANIRWIKFPRIAAKIDSLASQKEPLNILNQPAIFISDGDSLDDGVKMLDELIVRSKKQTYTKSDLPVLHKETDVTFAVNFDFSPLPNGTDGREHNFYKLLRYYLPGCTVDPSDRPKFIIDGQVANNPEDFIDMSQIKRIELLRGASGLVYGSTCVYAIYTSSLERKNTISNTSTKTIKLQSYQSHQIFYIPNYKNISQDQIDNRQTLYWNPNCLIIPQKENLPISFYTSDINGNFKIVVQGISSKGPIYSESRFRVE